MIFAGALLGELSEPALALLRLPEPPLPIVDERDGSVVGRVDLMWVDATKILGDGEIDDRHWRRGRLRGVRIAIGENVEADAAVDGPVTLTAEETAMLTRLLDELRDSGGELNRSACDLACDLFAARTRLRHAVDRARTAPAADGDVPPPPGLRREISFEVPGPVPVDDVFARFVVHGPAGSVRFSVITGWHADRMVVDGPFGIPSVDLLQRPTLAPVGAELSAHFDEPFADSRPSEQCELRAAGTCHTIGEPMAMIFALTAQLIRGGDQAVWGWLERWYRDLAGETSDDGDADE